MLTLLALDIGNAAKTILGIGGLIFVHELGHFLVGRLCGVKAEAFSIGFGPVIAKWQPGETEYRLSAVPLGGYVKFLGENPDERGDVDPRSFFAATYPRKVAIMLAGVTMNVVIAFVLFVAAFSAGVQMTPPVVGRTEPGLPAWENGLRPGDRIVEIDGHRMVDFMDVAQECALVREVELVVERDGARLPPLRFPTADAGEGIRRIGVTPPVHDDGTLRVVPESPAATAGLRDGDVVIAVDGTPTATVDEAVARHAAAKDRSKWTVERAGARTDIDVPVTRKWIVGILPDATTLVVRRGSAAAEAGLASGDAPVSVGGAATPTWSAFVAALRAAAPGTEVVVRRSGAESRHVAAAPAALIDGIAGAASGSEAVLVSPSAGSGETSPASAAGMPVGATLLEVDGRSITRFDDVREKVADAGKAGRALKLSWRAPDGSVRHGVDVLPLDAADPAQSGLGIAVATVTETVRETNVLRAAGLGLDRTHRWVMRILQTLRSLFTGGVSAKKLQGPVALAKATYETADTGFAYLFMFLGMISMNLAVLNVLPIPLLDGGQLAILTAEKIRGKPLPERVLEGIQWTGLVVLLGFMLFVIVNDIRNL